MKTRKIPTVEISMCNNAMNLVFISRFLREQMGNQQVELPFQNFSPENFTHLQNYNVGLYIMGLLTVT
jgi:hypothetical protein